jgi:hypothetical protein
MNRVVGTCSICSGAVTVPTVWCGVLPPTPTCSGCGAEAASHGPVIPMKPRKPTPFEQQLRDAFERGERDLEALRRAGHA